LFTLIASSNGVDVDSLAAMARAMRGGTGELRFGFDEKDPAHRWCGAAVRVPGLLPEDRYDIQPLLSPDGDVIFVCQVRLDNRDELLDRLRPARPGEIADSSLLFAAFLKWGESCSDYLAGDYAYAAYSKRSRKVVAAVDHYGHARLYYASSSSRIILSTQLAALRACAGLSLSCNEVALGVLAEGQWQNGATPYNEINQLPGGELLTWTQRDGTSGQLATRRWWNPETRPTTHFSNPDDYVQRTRELFTHAVNGCLRSLTPVSSTLSGGLDSGLVTAMAAHQLNRSGGNLTAFTHAPDPHYACPERRGWDADDAPYAAQTAAFHPNIRHVVLRSDGRAALDLVPQIHRYSGNPVRNGANHLWLDQIGCAAAASGSRVVLTGARGGCAFSYTGLGAFAELISRWQWKSAIQFATGAQRAGQRSAWKTIGGDLLPPRLFEMLRSRVYAEKAEKGQKKNRDQRLFLTLDAFRKRHAELVDRSLPTPRTRAHLAYGATEAFGIWSADSLPQWGIERRDPTSDRRLVEFLLTVPLAAFAHGGLWRGLARELGKGLMPDSVRLRQTRGEQAADYAPIVQRHIARYHEVRQRMARSPSCQQIFDMSALESAMNMAAKRKVAKILYDRIDRAIDAGTFLMEHERAA
jgi:asparagine synthase (glutamine-hydrolysing)